MWPHATRLSLHVALVLSLCVAPTPINADTHAASTPADGEVFARIKNVVVDGVEYTEGITIDHVKVVRAQDDPNATPISEIGFPGTDLFPRDEVITAPNVNVTIVFVPDPNAPEAPEDYSEVVLDGDTRISISNPQRNTVRVYLGRIAATAWGFFNAITPSGDAEIKHTEFQLEIGKNDGVAELLVIEGLVTIKKAVASESPIVATPAETLPDWGTFTLIKDQMTDARKVVTLTNTCSEPRTLKIVPTTNLPWITFASVMPEMKVEPGGEFKVPVVMKFNTNGLVAGSYSGSLVIECVDCDPACMLGWVKTVAVEVLAADEVRVGEGEVVRYQKDKPLPPASPASTDLKVRAITLPIKVFEATQLKNEPYVATEGATPAFCSTADRNFAYKAARYAIISATNENEKSEAYEKLGDVFRSVGENEKAKKAYDKVKKDDADFSLKRMETLRSIGKFEGIEKKLQEIASLADLSIATGRRQFTLAHNSLGTAKLERAVAALDKGDVPGVLKPANEALQYFQRIAKATEQEQQKFLSPLTMQQQSVFWTNYGRVLRTLGRYWTLEGNLTRAENYYEQAKAAFKEAKRSDDTNPYAITNLVGVSTSLGNVENLKPNPDQTKMLSHYQESEKGLAALDKGYLNLKGAQEARIVLDISQGRKVQLKPQMHYTLSEAKRGILVPDMVGRTREFAAETLAKLGLIPDFVDESEQVRKRKQCVAKQSPVKSFLKKGAAVHLWLRDCLKTSLEPSKPRERA